MTLGAGCWGPGIHWDAENSAAFVGPRTGTWPYSSSTCPTTAKNGLLIDQNTGKVYTTPPMGMYAYTPKATSADSGSNLSPSPLVLQSTTYVPKIGSNEPANLVIPVPSCGSAGILEYDTLTVDVTVGTNSSVSLGGLANGSRPVWEWTNSQNPTPTQGTDVLHGYKIDVSNAYQLYWSDEPWAAGLGSSAVPGVNSAGLMLGSFKIPNTVSGWIATDAVMPIDTTNSAGFTCSFWFKPTAWNDGSPLFSLYNAPNSSLIEVQLRTDFPNYLRLFFQTPSVNPTSSYTYNTGLAHMGANTWNFVAITFSPPSSLTLYCNGTSQALSIPYAPLWHATGMSLNSNYSYGNAPAASYANLRTWQRPLSSTEVATVLASPTSSGPSGGTAWWPLNDGTNVQRVVRTFTGVWAPAWTNGQPQQTSLNASMWGSGANASLVNAWSGGLTGLAYAPSLSTYTGA